jgi:hypothetical protein
MAWTAPMTFTANSVLTAAQLNTHLRDNMLETAPARATTAGGYFVTSSANSIVERVGARLTISPEEATSSTSYTDLATFGPQVTVNTSTIALVMWGCEIMNDSASSAATSRCAIDVSGATTNAASNNRSLCVTSTGTAAAPGSRYQASHVVYYDDLTPGANVFTLKYRASSGNATFGNRRLIVLPY